MPGFDFRSLFTEDPERQLVSGPGATSDWRIKPKSLLDEDADPRFPAFQQAWKQGAGLGDLFGPDPFKLQGTVAPSGGDNTRPDVAKVQTLLGRAGYLDLGQDGPSGYPNPNTDKATRDFQKDNGLQVDGVLKPNGPTIAKLGGLLGGGAEPASKPSNIVEGEWDWMDKKRMPDLRPAPQPVDKPANNGWDALIRILNRDRPELKPTPPRLPPSIPNGSDSPEEGGITGTLPRPQQNDPYPGHTINQEGIDANQAYAEMLVRDTDPSQSARMLKPAIDDYGDQGRGDVADLLARFQKIDGGKAEDLRRELHKATGEMLPYRIAPLGEGFREPTEEEKIAAAPKSPFGSADGADRWAAANMAEALLGKGDYRDGAVEHFRGEIARDRSAAMPYLAAVHQAMGDKNPALAAKFATQMKAEGLTAAADPGTKSDASAQSGSENQQVAKMGDQKVWPEIGRDIVGGGGIAIGGAIGAGGAVRPETGNGDFVKPGPQGPAGKPSVGGSTPQGQQTTIAVPEAGKQPVLTGPDPSKPQPQQGTPPQPAAQAVTAAAAEHSANAACSGEQPARKTCGSGQTESIARNPHPQTASTDRPREGCAPPSLYPGGSWQNHL